jgi:hypothetical protein
MIPGMAGDEFGDPTASFISGALGGRKQYSTRKNLLVNPGIWGRNPFIQQLLA